ncbi:MAG: mandelate racemase/muconate lactonizing enzyme family protein [Planctomycetes bacterium]|nr:mandelate racemase/muconate lactonizing enzyme family protein [Planctomycetota bacterium]
MTNSDSAHLHRASGPLQEHAFRRGPRITAVETLIPDDLMPGLLLLRIHTDAGAVDGEPVIGHGETYYIPHGVAATIHDWMARRLLGADAAAIESHWRFLYERCASFGGLGCEMRAISAIDLALWDILGQLCRQPIWRLLGGPVRDRVPIYNSCGGPTYGRLPKADPNSQGWPGHGSPGKPGPLEDNWSSIHAAGDLAEELLAEGYRAMKLWSLDRIYQAGGGHRISWSDLDEGLRPLREIRDRMGMKMELMLDGHGFFTLPAALRIAGAMRPLQPLWLEDVMRPDSIGAIADFRDRAGVPVAVSEMLITREQFRDVLARRAADYVMIDPTWVGGVSETRRLAELAQMHNVPVLMHDCTGPLTLMAGLHVAAATPIVTYQETVRAHIRTLYPHLIDENVTVEDGHIALAERPGLGVRLLPELFASQHPGYRVSRLS